MGRRIPLVVAGAADLAPGRYLAVLDAMRSERFVAPFARDEAGALTILGPSCRVSEAEAAAVAARGAPPSRDRDPPCQVAAAAASARRPGTPTPRMVENVRTPNSSAPSDFDAPTTWPRR